MLGAILAGTLFALVLVFLGKFLKRRFSVLFAVVPLGVFLYFLQYITPISNGKTIIQNISWLPSFGVNLNFTLDGLSLIFALLISGIGFLVFAYASEYLKGHAYLDRFYGYLGLFMSAMLGVVLADNVVTLFVFWELTSISSFFLIGFNNNDKASRKSAIAALSITGFGGVLFLGFALILGSITGTYDISEILNSKETIAQSPYYVPMIFLLFGAAFTKSAQFPFHFWLPGAMRAPTPVSTYLHSATMVKAGVYLLMRFTPILSGPEIWHYTLIAVGGLTMLYAAVQILFKTDLKAILAYSTISALGIMVFLTGLGTREALLAACVFILVHALYKATLFLITGIIDHKTHTRDITKLSGLRKVLLPIAAIGFLAALSNAGIPPTFGFIGKDLIYESTLNFGDWSIMLTTIAILTNILLLYAGFLVGIKPFSGPLPEVYNKIRLPNFMLWLPPAILAFLGVLFGLFPALIQDGLVQPALWALGVPTPDLHIKLWHGFNTVLLLSSITIAAGSLVYFSVKISEKRISASTKFETISPKTIIFKMAATFEKFSMKWTGFFQNGYLRNYINTILLFSIVSLGILLFSHIRLNIDFNAMTDITILEMATLVILIISILFAVTTQSRLAAVAALGVVGLSIAMIFLFYSAPDLAMTQFAIDTLTMILFVLVLYRLPKYLNLTNRRNRLKDIIIATAFGAMIALLSLEVWQETHNAETSRFYAENAYTLAKGKNVVNVILVDFRGIDTLMESVVLTIAAIGVFSLLKLRLHQKD